MRQLDDLLLLGDPRLYQRCQDIREDELSFVSGWVEDLHNVMEEIRKKYDFGRGIAAPQLGIMKRLVYINIDRPLVIINPVIKSTSKKMFELWDDCMSFPNLLVRVERHTNIVVEYMDDNWNQQTLHAEGSLSELIQHECDHLEGVLCINRAITDQSFKWRL